MLLLPPFFLVLLIVGSHLLQWAKERWHKSPHLSDWYLQPFNIAMYLIAAFSAQWIYKTFVSGLPISFTLPAILPIMVAVITYIVVNNTILGYALLLARNISWQQSGVLKLGNLLPEFIMACLGVVVAWLWLTSPWLILFALSPLLLMYRALLIPKLQAENMQKLQQVNQDLEAANNAIQQVNDELFLTLAKIFDARDPYVAGHAAQVATYATAIANELGLPSERIDAIRQSAYLHDIGKIAIPETILHKPGKLTDEEFALMKSHAAIGAEFLERVRVYVTWRPLFGITMNAGMAAAIPAVCKARIFRLKHVFSTFATPLRRWHQIGPITKVCRLTKLLPEYDGAAEPSSILRLLLPLSASPNGMLPTLSGTQHERWNAATKM